MKAGLTLWPSDVRDRALVVVFLVLPLILALLSLLAWRQPLPLSSSLIAIGAWQILVAILLAVPSPNRGAAPQLLNLGILLEGAGWILMGLASTRADLLTFAALDVGGLILAIAGLLLAGSAGLGALAARRG